MAQDISLQSDVVICGSGFAGLSAAVTVLGSGAEVIMLEKRPSLGGTSNFVKGTYGIESPLQYARNIEVTKEGSFLVQMDYNHWQANASLVRAFIDKAATNIMWLQQIGVEFQHVMGVWPGRPQVFHIFKSEKTLAQGATVIKTLTEEAKRKGLQIYTKTAAKGLLWDEAGRIAGVVAADRKGITFRVKGRAVIIATGGFSQDRKMLEEHTRFKNAEHEFDLGMTGDGIKMAWAIGAAPEGLATVLGAFKMKGANTKVRTNLGVALREPYLWVNKRGERFCAEDIRHETLNALTNQPEGIMYIIFDETTKHRIAEEQETVAHRPEVRLYQLKQIELDAEIKKGVKDGNIFVAENLPELGEKIGAEAIVFQKTLDEYNRCCQQHYDDVFFKNPKYLQPVKTPKYYAAKACVSLLSTLGGVKINDKTEALDKNYHVIPGLYAAGNCAGGLYGDTYDIQNTSGGASAFAIGSGRIAGEHVLDYIGKANF